MSANQNDYRSAQLSAAAELRITFPAEDLGERFKQTVRDASAEQMEPGDCWQRDGDGDDRGRWLETRDGVRFAPDDRDLTGPVGLFIGGGVLSFAAVMLFLVYLSEEQVMLAVGAGVAALLGVSLLNAARVQYPRAKRSPRFSGMYLLDDAVLVLDHYKQASTVPKDRLIDVSLRRRHEALTQLVFRYHNDDGGEDELGFSPATEHTLAMARRWLATSS